MRNPGEPPPHGPVSAERWVDYLDWVRGDIAAAVLALSPEEQRRSRLASGWTPLQMLSHVLHMEQRWFVWGFLGEPVTEPWGDWTAPDPWDEQGRERPGARWHVPEETTAEELRGRLEEVAARTRGVLRDYPLCALAAPGGRFAADPPSLEWICFHVLTEYARHAGHLDIAAELARQTQGAGTG